MIVSDPAIVPMAVGANFTEIAQLPLCEIGEVQLLVCLNPAVVVMLETLRVPLPLLLSVTVLAELVVPTVRFPKLRVVGLTVATGT